MLTGPEAALLAVMLLGLMLGVGCTLSLRDFRQVAAAPLPIAIGLVSQLVGMPLLALGLAAVFELPAPLALGLVFVACTPGGTLSNVFAYLARGNVALSVSMTAASSLISVVAMPVSLWFYAGSLTTTQMRIPYGGVAASLGSVLLPVVAGMAIRARNAALAARIERLASRIAFVALALMAALWAPKFWTYVGDTNAAGFCAISALALAGFALGFGAASIARLPLADRKVIALETGIQNTTLTFGIITLSFPPAQAAAFGWVPLVYGALTLIWAACLTVLLRRAT